jgi:protein gp37
MASGDEGGEAMNKTKIEWADYTWNPITGCLGPMGDGVRCSYCYANRLANGRLREMYLANPYVLAGDPADPFAPRFWPERVPQPRRVKIGPSRIFVCDMSDLFGPWVPTGCTASIFTTVQYSPQHTFLFLTKWPQRLAQFNPWPPNAWVGATATTSTEAEIALTHLADVDAAVRYISFEPLHEEIVLDMGVLDWGIIGQQTNPDLPPLLGWVYGLIDCLDRAGAKVFLKGNLQWIEPRQEWPKEKR